MSSVLRNVLVNCNCCANVVHSNSIITTVVILFWNNLFVYFFRPFDANYAVLIFEKLQGADVLTYLSSRHEYTEQMVATIIQQVCLGWRKCIPAIENYGHLTWASYFKESNFATFKKYLWLSGSGLRLACLFIVVLGFGRTAIFALAKLVPLGFAAWQHRDGLRPKFTSQTGRPGISSEGH